MIPTRSTLTSRWQFDCVDNFSCKFYIGSFMYTSSHNWEGTPTKEYQHRLSLTKQTNLGHISISLSSELRFFTRGFSIRAISGLENFYVSHIMRWSKPCADESSKLQARSGTPGTIKWHIPSPLGYVSDTSARTSTALNGWVATLYQIGIPISSTLRSGPDHQNSSLPRNNYAERH